MLLRTLAPNLSPTHAILPMVHNWRESYRTIHEYKTDVIESEEGDEQRRAVRNEPRRTVKFMDSMTGDNRKVFLDFMRTRQSKMTVIADVLYKVKMFEPPEAGSTVGGLNIAYPKWLKVGIDVMLMTGYIMETRKVFALPGNGVIIFAESSPYEWTRTVFISPALIGVIDDDLSVDHFTNTVQEQTVTFDVDPGGLVETQFTEGEYLDWREVFMLKPDWGRTVRINYQSPREDIDYGFGMVKHFDRIGYPRRLYQADYVAKSHAHAQATIDLFNRCQGRLKELLMPTWENDIEQQFIFPGLAQIVVNGVDFAQEYMGSRVYKRIMMRMADGSYIHRSVEDILALPDTDASVITLTEPLPEDITYNRETITGISWVLAVRFATDKLEIEWLTNQAAQYRLSFQTLENSEA